MERLDRIAFFWIGSETLIPELFVKSIRLVYGDNVEIFQLTNTVTSSVKGVSKVFRYELPEDLMMARLTAYDNFILKKGTIFYDADSLCLRKLSLRNFDEGLYIVKRTENMVLSSKINFTNYISSKKTVMNFPEFHNKYIKEVMPYMAGCVFINEETDFFKKSKKILEELPKRFHIWFGDQYAFSSLLKDNKTSYKLLDDKAYLSVIDNNFNQDDIFQVLKNPNSKVITFKGMSKIWMPKVFEFISDVLNKLNKKMA